MEEKGFLKDFWENLEEYLCSAALLVMTFVTFMNVFSSSKVGPMIGVKS